MSENQCFLVIGNKVADILSQIKDGYKIFDCHFAFDKEVDKSEKTTVRLRNGTVQMTLSQLPSKEITEWALTPGKYHDCAILVFDAENKLLDKTILQQAVCVDFKIEYELKRETESLTKIILKPQKLIVGNEYEVDNQWAFNI